MDPLPVEQPLSGTASELIPPAFARGTIEREGAAGRRWIAQLPARIDSLLLRWNLRLDGPTLHGYLGVVLPVRRGEVPLALKVSWVDRWSAGEGLALRSWAGQGAVRLLDEAPDREALLLERLDPSRTLEQVDALEAAAIAGGLLRRLGVPAPPGLRTLAEEVDGLARTMDEALAAQVPHVTRPLVDRVLELATGLPLSSEAVLVNEDLHFGNVLAGEREPWLVIDPKPLQGVVEYGVAPLLWTRFEEMGDRSAFERRFSVIVEAGELDPARARSWATVRAFEYWVWAAGLGLAEDAERSRRLLSWLQPSWFSP